MLSPRTETILRSIVEQYISRATPVPSQSISNNYELEISPATIRNEMAVLEREGYIVQPHTSAGRVPTSHAYRLFVNQLKYNLQLMNKAKKDMELIRKQHYLNKAKERLYEMVAILANVTQNVSFSTLPDNKQLFYMGISNVLRQPEFQSDPSGATQVIEVLETKKSKATWIP